MQCMCMQVTYCILAWVQMSVCVCPGWCLKHVIACYMHVCMLHISWLIRWSLTELKEREWGRFSVCLCCLGEPVANQIKLHFSIQWHFYNLFLCEVFFSPLTWIVACRLLPHLPLHRSVEHNSRLFVLLYSLWITNPSLLSAIPESQVRVLEVHLWFPVLFLWLSVYFVFLLLVLALLFPV